jgi:hypothetical protein
MPAVIVTSHTTAAMTTTSAAVLAAENDRKYALVQNDGPNTVWIKVNATAVANEGIRLDPGGHYEMGAQFGNLEQLAINGITATGTATMLTTQGV